MPPERINSVKGEPDAPASVISGCPSPSMSPLIVTLPPFKYGANPMVEPFRAGANWMFQVPGSLLWP